MFDATADIPLLFADFAKDCLCNGVTFKGLLQAPSNNTMNYGGELEQTLPTLTVSSLDVVTADIVAGDDGSIIEIGSDTYQVYQIFPDGYGLSELFISRCY